MISFYTRALLLLRRPPCWNKNGAARTTQHVTTRTTCRDVTQQVEFGLICSWQKSCTSLCFYSVLFDVAYGCI